MQASSQVWQVLDVLLVENAGDLTARGSGGPLRVSPGPLQICSERFSPGFKVWEGELVEVQCPGGGPGQGYMFRRYWPPTS